MLNWSVEQTKYPVAIRVPNADLISTGIKDETDYSILNKYQVTKCGNTVALLGLGSFYFKAVEIAKLIENIGINATIINPKYITGIDTELMEELKHAVSVFKTTEE